MLALLLLLGSSSKRCGFGETGVTYTNEDNVLDYLRHVVNLSQSIDRAGGLRLCWKAKLPVVDWDVNVRVTKVQ